MANEFDQSVYEANGYSNREEYLDSLREDYGGLVDILIGILPPSEDFDGLVTELEDAMDSGEYDELIRPLSPKTMTWEQLLLEILNMTPEQRKMNVKVTDHIGMGFTISDADEVKEMQTNYSEPVLVIN
jgi:hypothetical protein